MKARYPEAAAAISAWIDQQLSPGSRLPSVRRLAEDFSLKPSTAQKACSVLVAQGRLRKEGYKMIVAASRHGPPAMVHPVHVLSPYPWFNRAVARLLDREQVPCRAIHFDQINKWSALLELKKAQALPSSGLIVWPINLGPAEKVALQTWKTPLVLCNHPLETCATVEFDYQDGVRQAIEHLVKQGHTQVAYLSLGDSFSPDYDLREHYRKVCLQMGLTASAANIWRLGGKKPLPLQGKFLREKMRQHPRVTALVGIKTFCLVAMRFFSVPRDISLVGFFDLYDANLSKRTLTCVGLLEHERLALWAWTELKAQLSAWAEKLPAGEPRHLRLLPKLIVRETTPALRKTEPKTTAKKPDEKVFPTPFDPMSTWRNVYPFLKRLRRPDWHQVDLSRHVNHSFTRPHGWLGGLPLLHFPPGLRSIHGAPFQIIDEKRNRGRAVITFRSPHSHSSSGRLLPAGMSIRVATRARALYFLHGCGWPKPGSFATYRLCYEDGGREEIPLIPMAEKDDDRPSGPGPNIQDWWDAENSRDFPSAHRLLVTNLANPLEYERCLYTLEWINPRRAAALKEIRIEVDPDAGPALGLLAITALV